MQPSEQEIFEPFDESTLQPSKGLRLQRTPLVSVLVLLLGTYLLVSMFKDARYWLYGQDPIDLGDAATWIEEGGFDKDYDQVFVKLRGSPDVQHVAIAKTDSPQRLSYIRLLEGGGSLFIAAERNDEEIKKRQFGDVFIGRMQRLSQLRNFSQIESYFNNLLLTQNFQVSASDFFSAMNAASSSAKIEVHGEEGQTIALAPEDTVSITIKEPEFKIQLGRNSFHSFQEAQTAIKALGYPYYAPEEQTHPQYFQFWVRIPTDQQKVTEAKLNQTFPPASKADAAYGAVILPSTMTFLVKVNDIKTSTENLAFPYQDRSGRTGFELHEQKLIPREPQSGLLEFIRTDIHTIQIQKMIHVDPNGYILIAGDQPKDHWLTPILWLVVAVLVGVNFVNFVVVIYRRTKSQGLE